MLKMLLKHVVPGRYLQPTMKMEIFGDFIGKIFLLILCLLKLCHIESLFKEMQCVINQLLLVFKASSVLITFLA